MNIKNACIIALAMIAVSTSYAVDITFYGFVGQSGNVQKESTTDADTVASFGIVSNYDKGVTISLDIFNNQSKVDQPIGLIVRVKEDPEINEANTTVTIVDQSDKAKASQTLDSYLVVWKMDVIEKEKGMTDSSQTLHLTVSESE